MKEHFGDDAKGRKKAFYFLPWHCNFFCRYRYFQAQQPVGFCLAVALNDPGSSPGSVDQCIYGAVLSKRNHAGMLTSLHHAVNPHWLLDTVNSC